MRAIRILLPIGLLFFCASSLAATTIHVPADQPTIQAGIDAAMEGDTVLVADGTYTGDGNRDLDVGGVNLVVMSENGPYSCIIDCEGSLTDEHVGFQFKSGESTESVLQGFTIKNGFFFRGGAIVCDASSPTIENNILVFNKATGFGNLGGGGIGCYNGASPIIRDNTIAWNSATNYGGAIWCAWDYCSPHIVGNTIMRNYAGWEGGGIDFIFSSPTIEDNLIVENTAHLNCGGIAFGWSCNPTIIRNNTVIGNTSETGGSGGIGFANDTHPTITGNVITRNVAATTCGGVGFITDCDPDISGNVIAENRAEIGCGGIGFGTNCNPTLTGNTITGNSAGEAGGGIGMEENSNATIMNTILWNNDAPLGKELYIEADPTPSTLIISYSDVEGGEELVYVAEGCSLMWGEGMMDEEPMFVLPDKQDCRLLWDSPCIDTGCPDSLDADGTVCDMGSHFFDQDDFLTLYITPDDMWTGPGGQLGVTYTAINRWDQPEFFWALSQVLLPGGAAVNVVGPDRFTLPGNNTVQVHLNHPVPMATPVGVYEYWSRIGILPPELYDEDSFTFWIID
jgi:hypothetical protein